MSEIEQLAIAPPVDYPPVLARWIWGLQDTRRRTLHWLDGLDDAALDWSDAYAPNSIGTLLYHIAAIEADWIFADVFGGRWPDGIDAFFPVDVREEGGRLTPVLGESLARHLERLARVRELVLEALHELSDEDLSRQLPGEGYTSSPEWVFHHLMQHEAEHRGQIGELRVRAVGLGSKN